MPFLAIAPPIPSSDHSRRQLIDEFASVPSETPKAFHRKDDKFMPALVEGHMSRTGEAVALSRLRSGSSCSILVSTSGTQVNPRLGVRVGDVDKNAFVPEIRCRRVSEASPVDNDVHT